MELNFTGTIDEFHALFPTADASVLAQVTHILETLTVIGQQQESIMASVQDLLDAVAAEKAQVASGLAALTAQVQALQAQLATGSAVTPEQLDAVLVAITEIFTPDAAPAP
jgi:beta-phosphoglucomutase-like phosphatase (HAD superfamily)